MVVLWLAGGPPARADGPTVFAAASLTDALDAAIDAYEAAGHGPVTPVYESSSTLARQIEQGAPADLYLSANPNWMDYLADRGLIDVASRRLLLRNDLVLIAPAGAAVSLDIDEPGAIRAALGGGRLAMGDPDHVPAGLYGKAALESLGQWGAIAPHVARAANVRAALALVARGEAPLGIVYGSDAAAEPDVAVVGRFPASSHPPIAYPAALVIGAANAARARAFLRFLRTPEAAAIFARYGFAQAE